MITCKCVLDKQCEIQWAWFIYLGTGASGRTVGCWRQISFHNVKKRLNHTCFRDP